MSQRTLTRREAKAVTRRRLLDAALSIIDEDGEAAVTTTAVTRLAGIAQPSFYKHFADVDDLLLTLVDELADERRRATRAARRMARDAPGDCDRLRETFRIPLDDFLAHPQLFRLLLRTRHEPSPLGEWSRRLHEASRTALVDDLVAAGMRDRTTEERRRVEMVADGVMALTEGYALAHLDGRYPDVDEIIDMLIVFSTGYFPLFTATR